MTEKLVPRLLALLAAAALLLPLAVVAADAPQEMASGTVPTVLITGANRGIGFEFVRQYADRGWRVIATTRDPDSARELQVFAADRANVIVERLDLLDHAGIDALAARYAGQPIDVLLNNAGLMQGPDRGQMVGTIDYQEFDRFYRINAMGPLKVSEAFYPNVRSSEMKIMAALTTGPGKRGIPVPGFTLYKTSKAALDAIQKEIALRWRAQGIKVVTFSPGRVLTRGEAGVPGQETVAIEDSVAGMIRVLEELTMEQTGQIISWDGERID